VLDSDLKNKLKITKIQHENQKWQVKVENQAVEDIENKLNPLSTVSHQDPSEDSLEEVVSKESQEPSIKTQELLSTNS
jgi:hypothetical protein